MGARTTVSHGGLIPGGVTQLLLRAPSETSKLVALSVWSDGGLFQVRVFRDPVLPAALVTFPARDPIRPRTRFLNDEDVVDMTIQTPLLDRGGVAVSGEIEIIRGDSVVGSDYILEVTNVDTQGRPVDMSADWGTR